MNRNDIFMKKWNQWVHAAIRPLVIAAVMTICGASVFTACLSKSGHSASPQGRSITEQQFRNRMILRKAMLAHGFKPLDSEWWHFTLKDEPFPDTYFTFPVKQLN